ncbi:MAG TPA: hypothetical protein ENH72_04090 [Pseudomonas sabulinigri]|jgi:hypothetical protein|uniref:Uncharacterized protein n=1 Tax=marine sediment metagenome TaxID=412755 RepID=A0A0F9W774_9ZZZZ|nr:hypothetical protein [Halopseudomonas sabulinigri]HEC51865.1 hypothetical protein [Halopseudomonas sabulinigri]|tara:strand:- start:6507 stop:6980 length:474 start_codon:yes stop_codon:yes gene_type:complete
MKLVSVLRIILFYLLSVVLATVLGSLVQTQFNLLFLQEMNVPVELPTRLATSWHDLLNFTPLFAIMVAATLLLALPVAEGLGRIFKPWRGLLYLLAGAAGIWVAFTLANYLLPMPTFIAATRVTAGLLCMMLAVGVGSWLFGRLTKPKARRGLRVLG